MNIGSKFVIPKLFSKSKNVESSPNSSITSSDEKKLNFSSLSDLANFHLNNTTQMSSNIGDGSPGSKFKLPKLSFSNKTVSTASIQKSLPNFNSIKKSSEKEEIVKDSEISNEQNWKIDLSSAIQDKINLPIVTKESPAKTKIIIPQYIETDLKPFLENQITQHCEIDSTSILNKFLKIRKKKSTNFGKIFSKSYRLKHIPQVKHEFIKKNKIKCYKFSEPSPDDIVKSAFASRYI